MGFAQPDAGVKTFCRAVCPGLSNGDGSGAVLLPRAPCCRGRHSPSPCCYPWRGIWPGEEGTGLAESVSSHAVNMRREGKGGVERALQPLDHQTF